MVLTIAGFDPSSGAGVTADVKTIAAHGCYGVGCITALTVQSTAGVRRVEPISPETGHRHPRGVGIRPGDFCGPYRHVGIGESGSGGSDFLEKAGLGNIVLDPVIKSSSGPDLIDAAGARSLVERLFPLATVITPNVDEAADLTGLAVSNLEQMRLAATRLHAMGAASVVITGGHLEKAIDLLSFTSRRGAEQEVFKSDRLSRTLPMARAAHSPPQWHAIWRAAVDYRKPCCWRKRMSQPRLPMRIPWDGAPGRCIICIACISSGGS